MRSRALAWLLLPLALAGGCTSTAIPAARRPESWAEPVRREGLANLHRVTPTLWRGAQPTAHGFEALSAAGVTTVVNLRSHHDDRDLLLGTGLRYVRIPLAAGRLDEHDVAAVLAELTNPEAGTVFVHCRHGSDRTGAIIAAYRVVVQGWTRDDAIAEMTEGGFGFHPLYGNLVELIRSLDVERIRRELATR